jgi:outer membrane protein
MKKIAWIGVMAIVGLLLAKGVGRAEDIKIAVVDVNKIFAGYTKVADNQAEFDKFQKERQAAVQKQVDAIQKDVKPLQEKMDKQGKVMKKEEADKLKADIDGKQKEMIKLSSDLYKELQTKNKDLVEARIKDIEAAIAKLAKEKGYAVVINKEAVLYSPEAADLSDQVLAALNKK